MKKAWLTPTNSSLRRMGLSLGECGLDRLAARMAFFFFVTISHLVAYGMWSWSNPICLWFNATEPKNTARVVGATLHFSCCTFVSWRYSTYSQDTKQAPVVTYWLIFLGGRRGEDFSPLTMQSSFYLIHHVVRAPWHLGNSRNTMKGRGPSVSYSIQWRQKRFCNVKFSRFAYRCRCGVCSLRANGKISLQAQSVQEQMMPSCRTNLRNILESSCWVAHRRLYVCSVLLCCSVLLDVCHIIHNYESLFVAHTNLLPQVGYHGNFSWRFFIFLTDRLVTEYSFLSPWVMFFVVCLFAMCVQVCIGGGAGFIGSHLAKKLKADGWYVVCADWKANEFMKPEASQCHDNTAAMLTVPYSRLRLIIFRCSMFFAVLWDATLHVTVVCYAQYCRVAWCVGYPFVSSFSPHELCTYYGYLCSASLAVSVKIQGPPPPPWGYMTMRSVAGCCIMRYQI